MAEPIHSGEYVPVTPEYLANLDALLATVPPGPWDVDTVREGEDAHNALFTPDGKVIADSFNADLRALDCDVNEGRHFWDRGTRAAFEFFAAARESMPVLLAEVRRLRSLFPQMQEQVDEAVRLGTEANERYLAGEAAALRHLGLDADLLDEMAHAVERGERDLPERQNEHGGPLCIALFLKGLAGCVRRSRSAETGGCDDCLPYGVCETCGHDADAEGLIPHLRWLFSTGLERLEAGGPNARGESFWLGRSEIRALKGLLGCAPTAADAPVPPASDPLSVPVLPVQGEE
ncbi:MAG TPA: hypothetical protein VGV85_17295 [Longimicrobiaceae bacterium]|nr:hypothetical protein [Longimicrobiaceae bacterium]